MKTLINPIDETAGVLQYEGERKNQMHEKAIELLKSATDNLHKAVYAMEIFNIAVEKAMDNGLNCTTGGSKAIITKDGKVDSTKWWFDPIRPNTIRLAPQGMDGEDIPIDYTNVHQLKAWWGFVLQDTFWKIEVSYRSGRWGECLTFKIFYEDEEYDDVLKCKMKIPFETVDTNVSSVLKILGHKIE